jgi:Rps23 Pro-64 3,4-dihydroxylase Tpa1-like proline 4-hydroxylase
MESHYTKELMTKGYTIIDNVLPLDIAEHIYNTFLEENNWNVIDQTRENHYSHVFKSTNPFLPQEGEVYSSRFSRSNELESKDLIQNTFHDYFISLLNDVSPIKLNNYDIRCHKQDIGDYFRTHLDDYAGEINLIYYVNKNWRWDWGGILNVLSHDDLLLCDTIFPKYNRVVLLNNKIFRAPHFVNTVEKYALNPRYSIVAFTK